MVNCIFAGHCFEQSQCDSSCPVLAQTSYLLERNNIQLNSPVFHATPSELRRCISILDNSAGSIRTVVENMSTNALSDLLTYCAICQHWRGSQLHCTVYNLKYAQYLEAVQKSWSSNGDSEELDYVKIWISSAKVLIISNIDFVNFKDFQCQTLLSLLQSRMNPDLTTIVVSPQISTLVGDGPLFARLTDLLSKQKVV